MRRGIAEAIVAALLLAPTAAAGQAEKPLSEWEELTGEPKPAPAIPAAVREFVTARSPDLIEVRSLAGEAIPVDLSWYVPEAFETFAQGRFVGITVVGYEDYGYLLIDRAHRGAEAVIATGQRPTFSADGRYFAAAEMSEAGWSNLEGVALWEVRPEAVEARFFGDAFPFATDWRVDRWVRPDCVSVSAVDFEWQPPEGEDWESALPKAPRRYYSLEINGQAVSLRHAYEQLGCSVEETPQ